MNKRFLLAVSGGPDSMFMLNKYKHKDIVVATVNYNQRNDSGIDFEIVKDFCELYNIPFEFLILKKDDYSEGNFQSWAREKRYSFFTKVYKKYNCEKLLIAHNMDDFLETAIFNYKTKRNTKFYGIKKRNNLFGMNIYRPLLFSYFKKTITKKCLNKGIPFHFDYTNNEPKYSRNKIRIENNKKSKFWKIYLFIYFNFLNFLNCFNLYIINKNYKKWELFNFSQDEFEFLKKKENLIYLFINNNYDDIKLSKNKINSIQDFILSKNRTQKYKLSNNKYLFKKRGCLVQKEKNTL